MAFVFELPDVGEGVVEAEVVDWKVAIGDQVATDQPLCEITTDKAQIEIASPKSGTITKLYGDPGDIIRVHTPLCEIDESGAPAVAAQKAKSPKPTPTNGASAPIAAPPIAAPPIAAPVAAPAQSAQPASIPDSRGQTKATPAVRRRAREDDIDIHRVPGTGPGGRVTHADLDAFQTGGQAPMAVAPPALPQVTPSGAEERIKILGIRRKIAEQMVKAKHIAPHFTYVEEVDATRLVDFRTRLKAIAEQRGIKLSYIPIMMKMCSIAFRSFPNVNANMDEERFELVVKGDHNIGISCDTPNGLFVPVIKNVEQKSILQIAAELQDLLERTRNGKAQLHELKGGTFTITSVGSIGGAFATPILNVPEVAILGMNQIKDRAVVIDGEITIRKMMFLSPSFDHRVIDGAVGARFVAHLKQIIESPEHLLLELV